MSKLGLILGAVIVAIVAFWVVSKASAKELFSAANSASGVDATGQVIKAEIEVPPPEIAIGRVVERVPEAPIYGIDHSREGVNSIGAPVSKTSMSFEEWNKTDPISGFPERWMVGKDFVLNRFGFKTVLKNPSVCYNNYFSGMNICSDDITNPKYYNNDGTLKTGYYLAGGA